MPLQIIALKAPRSAVLGDPTAQIEALIGQAGFAGAMIRRLANYPAQQPAYGSGQSLGKSAGSRKRKRARTGPKPYRRTGTLGRNWRLSRLGRVSNDIVSETTNRVPYTVHVEGPPDGPQGERQTVVMRDKGWPNVRDEARAEWDIWKPRVIRILTQKDVKKPPL